MEIPTYITEVSQQMGYDYAIYLGEYKGEDVYSPMFNDPNTIGGRTCFIHVKGNSWRWSKNHDEAIKVMDYFGW